MTMHDLFSRLCSRYVWVNLFLLAGISAGIVWGSLWALDKYTRHGEAIIIPNLRGKTFEQAEALLSQKGLLLEISDSGYVKEQPFNTILDQSLAAGMSVKQGRILYVTINSSRMPTLVLPDIADNSSLREAESRLQAIGFKLTPTQYISGEKDWVYAVKVNGKAVSAGMRIPINMRITLVAGHGRQYEENEILVDTAFSSRAYEKEVHLDDYRL